MLARGARVAVVIRNLHFPCVAGLASGPVRIRNFPGGTRLAFSALRFGAETPSLARSTGGAAFLGVMAWLARNLPIGAVLRKRTVALVPRVTGIAIVAAKPATRLLVLALPGITRIKDLRQQTPQQDQDNQAQHEAHACLSVVIGTLPHGMRWLVLNSMPWLARGPSSQGWPMPRGRAG